MKILVVSLFLPVEHATHAGARYVFEVVRTLAARHEVTLLTRLDETERHLVKPLEVLCREVHLFAYPHLQRRSVIGIARLAMNYLRFSRRADRMARCGDFDLVQVEWVEAAVLMRRRVPLVIDALDVITKPAERRFREATGLARIPQLARYLLTKWTEEAIAARADAVITVSDFDRDYLLRMMPAVRARTVPIPAGMGFTGKPRHPRPNRILFVASFRNHHLNVEGALWFLDRVFPLVVREIPQVEVVIAGYGPPPELVARGESDPRIQVPGFVDDLEAAYAEAALFVAPILTGGGIIVKILDALAAGVPVVSTTYGNEGIAGNPGEHLHVADDPAAFAASVVSLLLDRERAGALGEGGRRLARERYSSQALLSRLEAVYDEVLKQ